MSSGGPLQILLSGLKVVMGEAAYFGFDCVLHTPPYLPHQKKNTPPPFHCLPVKSGYFGRTSWLS